MNFTRRDYLKTFASAAAGASLGLPNRSFADAGSPNILLIMADDMGFSDAGCFGGEIETPNIDRLAANGLRFTNFYNCARCCPTRASLLTGLYPHQVGLARNGRSLTRDGVTIAEALKPAGYQTAMSGKWHLSQTKPLPEPELHQQWLDHHYDHDGPFAPIDTYPVNRGFDRYYGNIWGVVNFFDPFSLVEGTETIKEVPDDYYITDAINEYAAEVVRDYLMCDSPFFLYLPHCAPHWPLHALPEDIEKYQGVYTDGWDALRERRYERMIELGLFERGNTPLPPVQSGERSWSDLSAEEKRFESQKMAVHAAMVDRMDQGIGRVLNALEETGQMENTVIFFLSDNGASPEIMHQPGYDRTSQTRDGRKVQYNGIYKPGAETTYACIGQGWASACNTPFRYWKAQSFEGGCHAPFIVSAPGMMQRRAGSIVDDSGHVIDIMPTCLDLAGADYPTEHAGHSIKPCEGESLMPLIIGEDREGHPALFFEHQGGRAVIQGDWKAVAHSNRSNDWELYHLASDRTETNDLAEQESERLLSLVNEWRQWAERAGVEGI